MPLTALLKTAPRGHVAFFVFCSKFCLLSRGRYGEKGKGEDKQISSLHAQTSELGNKSIRLVAQLEHLRHAPTAFWALLR